MRFLWLLLSASAATALKYDKHGKRTVALALSGGAAADPAAAQPNPPAWPESVIVFDPTDDVGAKIAEESAKLTEYKSGHFSSKRLAFFFKPGNYSFDAQIGYYVQVAGLGKTPDEVVIKPGPAGRGIYVPAVWTDGSGSLNTFWRCAEGFKHEADLTWAVSQASPLRRVVAAADLLLFDREAAKVHNCTDASGGFLADSRVEGKLVLGSQQQWCSRNVDLETASDPDDGWCSYTYVGCKGAPKATPPQETNGHQSKGHNLPKRVSVVGKTPRVAAKPYISIRGDGTYVLRVPAVVENAVGTDRLEDRVEDIPFEEVFVATTSHGSAAIQAALDAGHHVVFSPGVYQLDDALKVTRPGAVLLGLGMASLVAPASGAPCLAVEDAGGLRLAGVTLQASEVPDDANVTLLRWGGAGSRENPSVLSDVFARVGGPGSTKVRADVIVEVSASHVILDNLWLWRADHSEPWEGETWHQVNGPTTECVVEKGLVVTGEDVVAYGLAVEHTCGDLVEWSGERGACYFLQEELPYDVDQSYADAGHCGYRVTAKDHTCVAPGVYSFFHWHPCALPAGIIASKTAAFLNAFTWTLNGNEGILSVLERD